MSATNHTSNYELSQYIGSDEPKYLTDYNGDMSKIDVAIKSADTKAETANTGVATNASAITALDGAVSTMNTQLTTVASNTNGNTASINTINSLLGNGEPTTTDKTIIGAINEIYADITGGGTDIDADNVDYDNTTSGLTATNVQDALDEINGKIPSGGAVEADDVVYDNTSSGLTATNVQDAVDEVNGKFGILELRYDSTNNVPQYTIDGGSTWVNFSHGAVAQALIPTMSGNTQGDITVSASSNSADAYKAFDNDASTEWKPVSDPQTGSIGAYLQIDLGADYDIEYVEITQTGYGTYRGAVAVLESDDGTAFTSGDVDAYIATEENVTKTFRMGVGLHARYLRIQLDTELYWYMNGLKTVQVYGF